jgi:CBS domain-containing protein
MEVYTMAHWTVRDVMTTETITARDDASAAEIAAILAGRHISGVPIVDRFDAVVGLVSWTDLRDDIDIGEPAENRGGRWRRWSSMLRAPDRTAVEIMSAPPLTIPSDASLPAAARVMYRSHVDRLLVVDGDGKLRGIVTRSDLLKVHARLDAVIRDEVMQQVLGRTLMLRPGSVHATVNGGVVALVGRTDYRTSALAAVGLTEAVAGVTAVDDRLAFDVDDTMAPPETPERAAPDPLRGWWLGAGQSRTPAAEAAGDRLPGREEQKAHRSAVVQ